METKRSPKDELLARYARIVADVKDPVLNPKEEIYLSQFPNGMEILFELYNIAKKLDANVPRGRYIRLGVRTAELSPKPGDDDEGIMTIQFVRRKKKVLTM